MVLCVQKSVQGFVTDEPLFIAGLILMTLVIVADKLRMALCMNQQIGKISLASDFITKKILFGRCCIGHAPIVMYVLAT